MNRITTTITCLALFALGACAFEEEEIDESDIGVAQQGLYSYWECSANVQFDTPGPGTTTKSFAKNAGQKNWCKNKVKNVASNHCWSITEGGTTSYYTTSAIAYRVECNDDQGYCDDGTPETWYFSGSCTVDGDPL